MNPTHFHLAVTHLPIFGLLIGVVILLIGILKKSNPIKSVAFFLFICLSIASIPVFLTGEEAEDTIEELFPQSGDFIHEHEENAEKAIWAMAVLGALSVISLIAQAKGISSTQAIHLLTLVVALVTSVMFFRVGNLGGEIRHTEIRANQEADVIPVIESQESEDDDDDDD